MYDHKEIEKNWQKYWDLEKLYTPDLDKAEKPFYNLMMFPYPSAEGLHVGNMYAFTHSDCYGRYMRLLGYEVFEPIGLDGFGIHSENYAMKINEHIRDVSKRTEQKFYDQLHMIGNQYDWSRTVETYKPNYYKWTQWLFIKMYEKGLAYRKKSPVNWCPSCKTVLSDEQVINGECERCDSEVIKKQMNQWFFKITDYAERLLKNLKETDPQKKMNWSSDVKRGQINWIGKSSGANIKFKVKANDKEKVVEVFTTRPDTIFGATYLVIAPEHKVIEELKEEIENYKEVKEYVEESKNKDEQERIKEDKEKTGIELKGVKAINPVNNEELPVWTADYVLINYATGSIMAVPSHDVRDMEFADKFKLPIKKVVEPIESDYEIQKEDVFIGEGLAINSDFLNGFKTLEAKQKIINYLEKNRLGQESVTYKLRDWCVSRQRYWGPPIPMIKCKDCGWVTASIEDLPVELPDVDDFHPDGSGKGPLNKVETFVKTKCPKCGEPAERETDVSDPFVDSAWYFFRYLNTEDEDNALSKERMKKWMPVDMYIGGKEHTVLHLLYSRFVTMVLHDLGYIDFEEPYSNFFGHGLVIKDGAKMSKSKGNVVNPDDYIERFGADSVRMYLMFLGDVRQGGDWKDSAMAGMFRFTKKVHKLYSDLISEIKEDGYKLERMEDVKIPMLHKTVKKVSADLNRLSFNTSIAKIMEFFNWYMEEEKMIKKYEKYNLLSYLSIIIAPFAPHIAEEFWYNLGNKGSVFKQIWPSYIEDLTKEETFELVVQVNGKLKSRIQAKVDISKDAALKMAKDDKKIKAFLKDKKLLKEIFIENKLINFVVK